MGARSNLDLAALLDLGTFGGLLREVPRRRLAAMGAIAAALYAQADAEAPHRVKSTERTKIVMPASPYKPALAGQVSTGVCVC